MCLVDTEFAEEDEDLIAGEALKVTSGPDSGGSHEWIGMTKRAGDSRDPEGATGAESEKGLEGKLGVRFVVQFLKKK